MDANLKTTHSLALYVEIFISFYDTLMKEMCVGTTWLPLCMDVCQHAKWPFVWATKCRKYFLALIVYYKPFCVYISLTRLLDHYVCEARGVTGQAVPHSIGISEPLLH